MNCRDCEHNHHSIGREIIESRGFELHVPCIESNIGKSRLIGESGTCTAFSRNKILIDPSATCGDCQNYKASPEHTQNCRLDHRAIDSEWPACVNFTERLRA